MKKIILLLSFLLLLTSCADPKEVEKVDLSRCINIPLDLISWIEEWLTIDGGGNLIWVQAVKSKDFENVYFISWYLQWAWIKDKSYIATFTTNSLEYWKWMIGSVNSFSKEFSEYPELKNITKYSDWVKESSSCVENKNNI